MARIVINDEGNKHYFDDYGKRHREDGPATIWGKGGYEWYIGGMYMGCKTSNGMFSWFPISTSNRRSFPNGLQTVTNSIGDYWPKLN